MSNRKNQTLSRGGGVGQRLGKKLLVLLIVYSVLLGGFVYLFHEPTEAIGGRAATYQVKPRDKAWMTVSEPNMAGTMWESRPLEQIRVSTSGMTVQYRVHVSNVGWMTPISKFNPPPSCSLSIS